MKRETIEQTVIAITSKVLGTPEHEIEVESTLEDLTVDSLDCVEILMDCEKEFNLVIPDESAEACTTVKEICDMIESLIN